jgi:hypothetical protein
MASMLSKFELSSFVLVGATNYPYVCIPVDTKDVPDHPTGGDAREIVHWYLSILEWRSHP